MDSGLLPYGKFAPIRVFWIFMSVLAFETRKKHPNFVVEISHCGKTAFRTAKTPKKAAFARVFRFTFRMQRITLAPRIGFAVD
ncbi:MAG: hypothetical protein K2W91_08085 [Novosphingobium sp.]|nr:hypothetical protein [Novosphingobium sp.]